MTRLMGYVGAYRGRIILVLIFVLVRTAATLAGGYMLRPIINTYIAPENGVGNIVGLGLALLVLALEVCLG